MRLYGSNEDATNVKLSVYGVNNDTWADSTITWNNAPGSLTVLLDTVSVNNVAKYYEFDVTNFVKNEFVGDKTASFVIKDSVSFNKAITFNSSENGRFQPQLVVDYSDDTTIISMRSINKNGIIVTKMSTEGNTLSNSTLYTKARVYPNPVNRKIHIAFPRSYKGNFNFIMIDMLGRTFNLGKHNIISGGYDVDLDISKLPLKTGQYFIRILSDVQNDQVIKLIVQ